MALSKSSIPVTNYGGVVYLEKTAGEAGIYPGMLLRLSTDDKFYMQATDAEKCSVIVAIEDALQGKTVSDVYTIAYPVRAIQFRPGEEFHGLLTAGQSVGIGEKCIADGNGKFRSASDSGSNSAYAIVEALEAEDLTGLAAVDTLVRFRVL